MSTAEKVIVDRIIEIATEREEARAGNDACQYDIDIRIMTKKIDLLLGILVETRALGLEAE